MIHPYTHIHTHTRTHNTHILYIHTCTYMHAYIHTYIHTYILVHTYIRPYIHSFTHSPIHPFIHLFIHLFTHLPIYPSVHPPPRREAESLRELGQLQRQVLRERFTHGERHIRGVYEKHVTGRALEHAWEIWVAHTVQWRKWQNSSNTAAVQQQNGATLVSATILYIFYSVTWCDTV